MKKYQNGGDTRPVQNAPKVTISPSSGSSKTSVKKVSTKKANPPRGTMDLIRGSKKSDYIGTVTQAAKKGGAVKKYQDGGKTGAQLKKEGAAMKAKGQAMKAKGQTMKMQGTAMKKVGQDQFLKKAETAQDLINYRTKKGQIQNMNPEMLTSLKSRVNRAAEIKKERVSKKYQNGGKTGAQLKKEGAAMKAKGQAMKAEGKAMKALGKASISPAKGMYDELDTRQRAAAIKARETGDLFGRGTGTGSQNRTVAEQRILDKDMAIIRAKEAQAKIKSQKESAAKSAERKKVAEIQAKGGYKGIKKKGGMVKTTVKKMGRKK